MGEQDASWLPQRMLRRAANMLAVGDGGDSVPAAELVDVASAPDLAAPAPTHRRRQSDSSFSSLKRLVKDKVPRAVSMRRPHRAMSESRSDHHAVGSTNGVPTGSAPATPPPAPFPAHEAFDVPEMLRVGIPMLKVSAKKVRSQVVKLDPDEGILYDSWKSHRSASRAR